MSVANRAIAKKEIDRANFIEVARISLLFAGSGLHKYSPNLMQTKAQPMRIPVLTLYRRFLTIKARGQYRLIFETGTYVNGRRLPLQGRGWGFESLRAHHCEISNRKSRDLKFEI